MTKKNHITDNIYFFDGMFFEIVDQKHIPRYDICVRHDDSKYQKEVLRLKTELKSMT